MMPLRNQPRIYEINTWVWLSALAKASSGAVTLANVDSSEWDRIAACGFDAVWLMGVWERSPAGVAISNRNHGLLDEFRGVLPDYRLEDNIGSAYCVRRYIVDQRLGGPEGLAIARGELARRGISLLLDFVPNHAAPDAPSITDFPEHFMSGSLEELDRDASSFIKVGDRVFACGRDPYFPAWSDTVQVNAFHPGFRPWVTDLLRMIANQCDGVRCDMAMLLMNDIFHRTWGDRAGPVPATEYWSEVIRAVQESHPDFAFIAEAYWDLEWPLQQQGFDYCYDKRLYDRLVARQAEEVRLHLLADLAYQQKLLRFIENHDEPRSAVSFSPAQERAAALTMATIPGAKLFYEGQIEGRQVRVPVFLRRRPEERLDPELEHFYLKLLELIKPSVFRDGDWQLCQCSTKENTTDATTLVAWCWRDTAEYRLIIVNLADVKTTGNISVPCIDLSESWQLQELFSEESYPCGSAELSRSGLFVEMKPWEGRLYQLTTIKAGW